MASVALRAYRIADGRFPIFDGTGARLYGGRWNSAGRNVIYASETYAGAILEVLVHANLGRIPKTHALIEIDVPASVAVESITSADVSRWDARDQIASRAYGDQWLMEQRTAVLIVPSAVTRGREHNLLFNPDHPDFRKITASKPQPIIWDERLFKQ
jgi:RES domain-containing protein